MATDKNLRRLSFCAVVVSTTIFSPGVVKAQTLEEIIVTAQRREQSLQEVPISIETFSGTEIAAQGFRDMVELSNFSPAVQIETNQDRINITIRGIGTAGNNQALEQSAPTFVDGIHFGRSGQILGAFLDVQRVEILRGPQPVFFGQNANAGAFSITTRKPTPEWQGNLRAEVGNQDRQTLEFGFGGPITDTLGIRFAGKYDQSEGYLKDLLTRKTFPEYDARMGRVILQWTPNDKFRATAKFQTGKLNSGGDGEAVQRGIGSDDPPFDRYASQVLITGVPDADLAPVPDSFDAGWGVAPGNTYLNPRLAGVAGLEESDRTSIDLSGFAPAYLATQPYGPDGPSSAAAFDDLEPWDTYLDLSYTLDNGIELSSLTGWSHYERRNAEDNSGVYYMSNYTFRSEDLDQLSQEFRVASPTGGKVEWMAGLYYHKNDLDLRTIGLRANVRRPARNPRGGEDAEWKSAFATLTFNFLDDRASIDLGGRYTEVDKIGFQVQYEQTWIFADVNVPGGEFIIPNGTRHCCRVSRRDFLVDPIYSQYVGATPIGITPEFLGLGDDDNNRNYAPFSTSQFDPQVTLRYRPTDDISLYAKYAEAFKSGAFEVELKSTPPPENFVFGNEYATTYELGMKANFLDGRGRANVTLFDTEIEDLQVGTTLPLAVVNATGQASATVNAAAQTVTGIEFDASMAVTDRLTLGLSGGLFDGEMASFENAGCTDYESDNADTGPCISEAEAEALGDPDLENTIDRTGEPAPRTPDWVFILNADYWMPIRDKYKLSFNGRFKTSDGYLTNIETFESVVTMPKHTDLNLKLGFGDIDGVWEVALYGRNLTEPRKEYNPEFDVDPDAFVNTALPQSAFKTYGVQFRYNYN